MTNRPIAITLIIQNRLGELASAIEPVRDYSTGACSGSNTELFFSDEVDEIDQALEICSGCPIRLVCLEDALESNEYGIWGGTTESMREQIKANRIPARSKQVRTDLPDLEEVAYEVKGILSNPVSKLCRDYQVEPRTIFRWRDDIRSSEQAMELVQRITKHG
jgi:WhiB family redox-sensing transcriptional regulator